MRIIVYDVSTLEHCSFIQIDIGMDICLWVSHLSLQPIPINLTEMILDSNTNVTQGNMKIPCTQRNRFVSVLVDMSMDLFST